MCWNADISINTFLFSCFSLIFIFVTNRFTRYKTPFFDNPLMYLFFFALASMQWVEHLLWNHLNDTSANIKLSKLLSVVVMIQPLFLILMIPTMLIRYIMLFLYAVYIIFYFKDSKNYHTSVAKNGHLQWGFMDYKGYEYIWVFVFLLFYFIPLFQLKHLGITLFLLLLTVLSLVFYFKHHTFGTMWCWATNVTLLYFLIDILLIQPYLNHSIC